jgi:hypothetical protein
MRRASSVRRIFTSPIWVIDAGVDTAWVRERIKERVGALANLDPGRLMRPASVAEAYWQIYQKPRDAWSFDRSPDCFNIG